MGFITSVFDVKRLAQNLDRKPALPDRNPHSAISGNAIESTITQLDDYVFDNIFIPILTDDEIPIGKLDFERFTEDDIYLLHDAFDKCNFDLLEFCAGMQSFSASAVERKTVF